MNKRDTNYWLAGILDHTLQKMHASNGIKTCDSEFLAILKKHKLQGRISIPELLKMNSFKRFDQKLVIASLMHEKVKINAFADKHQLAISEIANEFINQKIAALPIIIKGLSIFSLTNDVSNIRFSVDIDMIYSDPEFLSAILTELGYIREDTVSSHEHCIMYKNDVTIEIHNYIPVIHYSKGAIKKAVKTEKNNKQLYFENAAVEETMIRYEDLVTNAQPSSFLHGILVPSINDQVLILCTHIFRNYVKSQFSFASQIKLAELLDVLDLIRHQSFELELFVKENCYETSVLFTACLLEKLFGERDFLDALCPSPDRAQLLFPKILQWSGAMYLPRLPEELVYFGLSEFIDALETKPIILSQDKLGTQLFDLHKYNSHGITQLESLVVTLSDNCLVLVVKLQELIPSQTADVVELFTEEHRCCFVIEDNSITTEETYEGYSWELMQGDYTLKIEIPLCYLDVYGNLKLSFIFSVVRWGTGPLSTCVPMKISLND
ncbi:hypothetical protein PA598K_03657 [Paenibacillus sp. 598K]|uniref:nucleotidyltransferase family protein n=1 Tax=Paenibacillus sp. 598K TaxID=1117987 RepID=UPI000FFADFE5|nr:nucleotidyltransferase family protein [Paenibacillus sp. 598K]GBF75265.1 hypothetical protein PA598K_03657 [Paenibacillus sp. 598K]